MIIDIDKIVKEWSYRIDSGKPNPKNSVHLYHLSDILIEYRWPTQAIDELLNNIKNGVITLPNVVLNEGTQQEATLNTAMMETAALIGTTGVSRQPFIDLLSVPKIFKVIKIKSKDDVKDFKKQCKDIIKLSKVAKKELLKGVGKSGDWNSTGVSMIKDFILPELKMEDGVPVFYENSLQDIAVAGGLAWGMLDFVAEKVSFKPMFIHDKIMDFYKAEINRGITRKGSKAATPDAILSNVSADKLLTALKDDTNEIVGNESDGTVKLGKDIIYIQASLKKGVGSSQIGKFTKLLRSTYNLGMGTKEASTFLQEDRNEIENMIYEGLWDKVKSFTTSIFSKAKNLVNRGLSRLKGFFSKSFKDGTKIKAKTINKLTRGYTIKEWTEEDVDLLTEGTMNNNTRATIKAIYSNPTNAYKNLNKEVTALEKKMNTLGDLGYGKINKITSTPKKIPITKNDKEPGSKVVLTLIANIAALEMVQDLASKSSKLKKIISNLITEMLFGATNQPLWKVYGKMSTSDKAFSYLGTAKTVEKRFDGDDINIELLGVDVHPHTNNAYYVITCYLLQEIADAGKFYVKVRTGTNSSSNITQNYEGQSIIGAFDIDKKLKEII
jgi:hypothetical protein